MHKNSISILMLLAFFSMSAVATTELENKEKQKKESIVTTIREYTPSKEYWGAAVVLVALWVAKISSKKIPNIFSGPIDVAKRRPLSVAFAWLGGIIKYKRYAYLPACLSLIVPPAVDILVALYVSQIGNINSSVLRTVESFNCKSNFCKYNYEICLLLLAVGYAYEVYQEKKHKKEKEEIVSEA